MSFRSNRQHKSRPIFLLIFCALVLALFIIFGPDEPLQRAHNILPDGTIVSNHQGLLISEVMSANGSALPDENGNFSDWVEIWNSTDTAMNLKGISLSNRSDRARFLFPEMILAPDERIVVFCDKTNQNEAGRELHAKFKISSLQCTVFMFDTQGMILSEVHVPTLNVNETWYLNEDGEYQKGENFYSPGYPNTMEGHLAYIENYQIEPGALQINEIMAAPKTGLRDEDGDLSDWVEIKNNSDKVIDLSNYCLSDKEHRPVKWRFPDGAIISPGSTFLVFCSGKDRPNVGGYPHTNFAISAEGETITLSTRTGQLVDRVVFENLPADASYGRNPDTGNWQIYTLATPGADNNAQGGAMAERFLRSLNPTQVYIWEAMSSNTAVELSPGEPFCDWVELYNQGSEPVDLSNWGLSDNVKWPRKWQFPQGTVIRPGEFKVIRLNKSKEPGSDASMLQASYALKRAGGETVTLSFPDGRVIDKMPMPELPANISYGRTNTKNGFFYFNAATPGEDNATPFAGFAQTPVLSHAGGLYKENILLEMSVEDGSLIRYTLDGSTPTLENGQVYERPLEISSTMVVRARAFKAGLQGSATVTNTYVMKTYYTMPVVCLTTEPETLWSNVDGMYAAGEGVDLASYKNIPFRNPTPIYRQFGKIHRPGYGEMFEEGKETAVFSQGIEFGLIGQYSLDMPQKSFKLKAKAPMGERYFNAKIFEDRPFTQYKKLVLRVSGNDCVWTRMVDGVQSRLVDQVPDTTVIHQAWRPVIVYLNGQYWGHYNLRERVSRYFVAAHEGIPLEKADDMEIIEGSSKTYYGTNKNYLEMIKRIRKSDPKNNPEDLQYILDNVDVDNLFDYLTYQIFFANTDSGNIRFYRVPGGKWRYIMFDMDYGLFNSSNNGIRNMMNPKGHGANDDLDNSLWLKLLENEQMFDRFMTRFGQLFQFFTTERMLAQIDECYNILQPEMTMHFERWAEHNLKNISFDQPQTVDGCLRYWNERVDRLRNVAMKRPRYAWVQMKEWYKLSDEIMIHYCGPKPEFPPGATVSKKDIENTK
ncbi:MAG: lamin tail domain-containing protein [Christensenellales bacterium]|jgi:hypothetical protein|nr:hypothetical protein [Clostridiales bacterium]